MNQWEPLTPEEAIRREEKQQIKRIAGQVGVVALLFVAVQIPVVVADWVLGIASSGGTMFSLSKWLDYQCEEAAVLWGLLKYLLLLGVPLLAGVYFCRGRQTKPFSVKRVSAGEAIAYVGMGLAVCVTANFVGSWIEEWFAVFGIEQLSTTEFADNSIATMGLTFLSTAVLPALMEEALFRGVILQSLRPAGDRTALWVSSILFGLAHGTLSQVPFAILTGLMFGFIVLKTGNLWLSIVVHFLNNASAVLFAYGLKTVPDEQAGVYYMLLFVVMTGWGLVGSLFLYHRRRDGISSLGDCPRSSLTSVVRGRLIFFSPTILLFAVFMVVVTLMNTTLLEMVL